MDADDGGGFGEARRAGIQHEVDLSIEFAGDVVTAGGLVGTGLDRGDRRAGLGDHVREDDLIGTAEGDRLVLEEIGFVEFEGGGDFAATLGGDVEDQGDRAGP